MLNIMNYLMLIIPILVNVAFITLLERKILGYSQLRKGPNKVSFLGVIQPFNDAIKLFSKEMLFPITSNLLQYLLSPTISIFIVLGSYLIFPIQEYIFSIGLSMMFLYTMLSMNIYPLLISGWASNSKYALVGAMRAIAQTVSYEVSLATIMIFYMGLSCSTNLEEMSKMNEVWNKGLIFVPMMGIWFISCLAETNRTPFDFAEGESELVSGFNVEYGGMGFALIFMAEYGSIMFLSVVFSFLFFCSNSNSFTSFCVPGMIISIWVWIRATFPRYRYDKLMNLAWKIYLPSCLFILGYMLMLINYF